jgi:uncharacterized FlaG/YvyC family protein
MASPVPAAIRTARNAAPTGLAENRNADAEPQRPSLASVVNQALHETGDLLDAHSLELDIDRTTGRTVGRIVSANTGEVLVQIPSKEMLALIARVREALGPLVDESI